MGVRKILRRVGWALIWSALLIFAFLGYQLFITDLLNGRVQASAQAELVTDLAERRQELPEPTTVTVPEEDPPGDAPVVAAPRVDFVPEEIGEEGETLGRIVIPEIEVDAVVFNGVSRETLKMGPGHLPHTPVPGQPGNAVVSGHRTTYGRPFYDLDLLEVGDLIEVETATGLHVFEVRRSFIVAPDDVYVAESIPGAWLTLTTCHPHFSAAERLIIQAELIEGPNLDYANLLARRYVEPEEPS